jgi:hypothetical protein
MLREARSSVMNFTGRIFFTLPVKFITLDAASPGRRVQKMYEAETMIAR